MNTKDSILGNGVVIMSQADFDAIINERAQSIAEKIAKETAATAANQIAPTENVRYLDRKEASEVLHVSTTTIWRWTKQGIIHGKQIGGRRILYNYNELINAIEQEKKGLYA